MLFAVVAFIIAGVVLLAFGKIIFGVILLALGLVPAALLLLFGAARRPGTSRQAETGQAHGVFESDSREFDE